MAENIDRITKRAPKEVRGTFLFPSRRRQALASSARLLHSQNPKARLFSTHRPFPFPPIQAEEEELDILDDALFLLSREDDNNTLNRKVGGGGGGRLYCRSSLQAQ